jgi:hypothetical protein
MVESNSNRSRSPTVFKTVFSPAELTLRIVWYPSPDSNRDTYNTPFERAAFTSLARGALEHRVRFELTGLGICSPLHWASLPPVHIMVPAEGIEPSQER